MHNDFYASGFLFHLPTQQILLQQSHESREYWSLFEGHKNDAKTPEEAFKNIIHEKLQVKIPLTAVHPVYDYVHHTYKKPHFILYASVDIPRSNFKVNDDTTVSWFNFKQIYKLPIAPQTKHDITIGERVLNILIREATEEQQPQLVNES